MDVLRVNSVRERKIRLNTNEIAVFGVLGALMYAQKAVLAALPNIHLSAVMIAAITIVYGVKALYPMYVYIFLEGLFGGFTAWWVPYLYVWTILWGVVILLRNHIRGRKAVIIYMLTVGLHGLLFGTLFAPAEALLFGMNFEGMIAWIVAGLGFDLVHGISNFCLGILILPMANVLAKLKNNSVF